MTEDNKTTEVSTDRNSRSAETRDSQTRRTPWAPPSMLDAPEPPPGYQFRWIREATRGIEDKSNMSKRIREGYEPVRAEDYPEFEAPTIDSGSNSGVIGVGGLILAKVPVETANERNAYFKDQADSAMQGVDQNFMRESDARMPIKDSDIQRTSKVAFGSKPTKNG
jgi:hypothetical protein|tara:strand:+ start:9154 stop:9651 length:498 start_codon:yes stop_codon:yes gene_type:complete